MMERIAERVAIAGEVSFGYVGGDCDCGFGGFTSHVLRRFRFELRAGLFWKSNCDLLRGRFACHVWRLAQDQCDWQQKNAF